ncbi:hypothetical protein [Actinomadura violacea]|uniref:Uncharacterized protein n=1 Tax=Actinomadura violacea TaxID=2819934 RepID=A0ABS3S627_9ACTN|nr:hypothetical protein [Actinomadura violacea]MBO2464459.1 hypothetical protein [Actinomadura violacea]
MTEPLSSRLGESATVTSCPRTGNPYIRRAESSPVRQMYAARLLALAEQTRSLAARERQVENRFHELNARESRVVEAEERIAELAQFIAAAAFRAGAAEAAAQEASLGQVTEALAQPWGLGPVAVDLRVCDRDLTARIIPGSGFDPAEVLASMMNAVWSQDGTDEVVESHGE